MVKTSFFQDKQAWESFISSNQEASFLQSFNWGEFQKKIKNKIFRFKIASQGEIKGVFLLVKKEAKRGNYLECPGGPIIDWTKPIYFEEFLKQVKEIGEKEDCLFIRVRPQITQSLANELLFKNKGFLKAPMHLHAELTLRLDLSKSEDQLLRNMRKNTRYSIKKAIRQGVRIKKSTNPEDIKILYKLQLETVKRSHFIPFKEEYFKKEFETFLKDNQIRLFQAIYKKEILASALIIFYNNEAVYHYSGSTNKYRKIPASYLLQWEAIKEAKKRKLKYYNFWGIAPENKPRHRFAGVSLFKKGFGGEELEYLHAQDLPFKPAYYLVHLMERIRKIYRRL
ncbi:hypothetical protein COT75_02695 [Candidatus Beckwithbacteria bacterium CG10_big_fil_rev_8_21_14_0_10_34_10]|uniref:N-acetyltransferase domain-containing protein n=1 Tax=Candidatus Beckwithbacteria bacterium CG10_big_fil_rev_8_21_14_0_10_34_10 TaxID=1974495 RepID=A0A2H0W8Z2_9BACT|nr:MAG: hypothetical protein COT75_02695 [Candidatus Beckwithbacteria bacterium CG10_big_fil_rev_8_21_14_0_10_34_10]